MGHCLIHQLPLQLPILTLRMLIVLSTSTQSWTSLGIQVFILLLCKSSLIHRYVLITYGQHYYLVSSVPTIFPLDIYARLCMVDSLEKLGVDRYFKHEITSVLDETYRSGSIFMC